MSLLAPVQCKAQAKPVLASRRSIPSISEGQASSCHEPVGDSLRKHTPGHSPSCTTHRERALVQQAARARWVELQPAELTRRARPMKFVRLIAMQEVIPFRAFLDCALDGQPHGHKADAVLAIPGVKPGLKVIKDTVVAEAVEGGRRFAVKP